ncbi:response regulator transcription factor [Verrucomicrobia bacterium]|nr:response regulator transcription factor [Verrucomicrobiales bacterium]MDC0201002.1 response regulator transcription factor [Verrucomicrobiota bacterium]
MYTVLIAEDESDIRQLISFNLERESMDTLLAKDGAEAFEIAKEKGPDLIILDLMLPKMDGFTVFKELRLDSRTKDIPVIMLTAKAQLDDVITGLEMGADDYLTKPFSPKELVLRVKALLRRIKTTTANSVINSGKFRLDKNSLHCFVSGEQIDLTPTEFKLLILMVEREGTVQNREDLLREVWGYRDTANSRTLDTHVKRLREKLGDLSRCIETVRSVGYQYSSNA